jgi:hypothetical protein
LRADTQRCCTKYFWTLQKEKIKPSPKPYATMRGLTRLPLGHPFPLSTYYNLWIFGLLSTIFNSNTM